MKPIVLTIEGLHSFREQQTIDFEQLTGTGVFGIFGPTGSGKSTILDAITLALYGSVGRAKNRTQGILNHAEKSLVVSFQFAIGAGTDRKIYRVDRRYERNTETTVKNKYSRISELDANQEELVVLANRDGEVTELVQQILGLKLEDFTRAVVLPQGKFAEFLLLEGRKRREMLQRIFSLERFGYQLSDRLNERHKTTKQSLDLIVAEQNGMGDCSKQALAQAEKLLYEAIANEQEAIQTYDGALVQHERAKRIVGLQEQLSKTNLQLEQHTAAEPEILRIKEKIAVSEKAEYVRPFVNQLEETQIEEKGYQEVKLELEHSIATLRVETQTAKALYELAQHEQKKKAPGLIKWQTQLEVARGIEEELAQLIHVSEQLQNTNDEKQQAYTKIVLEIQQSKELDQTISSQLQEQRDKILLNTVTPEFRALVQQTTSKYEAYQTAVKELEHIKLEETRRAAEFAKAQGQVQMCREQQATLKTQLREAERRLQEIQEQQPASEEQLVKAESRLSIGKTKAEILLQLESANEDDCEKIKHLEKEVQEVSEKLLATTGELERSIVQLDILRMQYQEFVYQDKHAIALTLAADLQAGEACPVCGSVNHPQPAVYNESLKQDTNEREQLELSIQTMEDQVKELANQEATYKMDLRVMEAKLSDLRKGYESRLKQSVNLQIEIVGFLGIENEQTQTTAATTRSAQEIYDWLAKELGLIEQKRIKWFAWKQTFEALSLQAEESQAQLHTCTSQVAVNEQKEESTQQEFVTIKQTLDEKEKLLYRAEQSLHESLSRIGYDSVLTALQDIQFKDTCVAEAMHSEKELQDRQNTVKKQVQEQSMLESNLRVELAELQNSLANSNVTITEKQAKWKEITAGKPAEELQLQVVRELNQLAETELNTQKNFELKSNLLVDTERTLTQAYTRCEEVAQRLSKIGQELNQKLSQHNFSSIQEVKDAILQPEEFNSLKQQVLAYEDLGKTLQTEKVRLLDNLDGEQITTDQWLQIQTDLQMYEKQKQEAIGACGAAKVQYKHLQEKHEIWSALEAKRENLDKQFKYLEQLKNLLRGDRFVEFLAQEQLQFVAHQASNRLKNLTRNRYALEIDEDGGFIMRDDANGGAKRPVTSLSGGETFLTSLALALSLSTQIQLRGRFPLEFFFLDEGFGTLDSELLDVVMSTLEKLRLENMTIGIISHVPELQQRMHRRLIVEPAETAGRGSRVRIERM